MKIDYEYVKRLLEATEATSCPFVSLDGFEEENHIEASNEFVFHLAILCDLGFIESEYGTRVTADSLKRYQPWRLTAKGHQFLNDLQQPGVWEKLRGNFMDHGPITFVGIARRIVMARVDRKRWGDG